MPRQVRPPGGVGVIAGEFDLGTYGVLGGEIELFGSWVPDPNEPAVAADQLLQLAGYLEDTEKPLLSAATIAERDTQRRFDTETDPDGTPWIALDPDYLEWKESSEHGNPGILQLTERMRKAATSPGAWQVVGNDTLVFDPSGLPLYAYMHQRGSGAQNVGRALTHRESVRFQREHGKLTEGATGSAKDSLGIGRGNALPARPFIGLSEEAVNEIAFLFDLWFDAKDEVFIHPMTGSAQRWQFRGNVRLFGPKV